MTDRHQAGNDTRVTSPSRDGRAAPRSRRRQFAALYRAHFGLVWSLVRHLGVDDAQHEDVVQEVWLRVYRRLHTLDSTASTKAWLCSIARHVALHHHRSHYRRNRKLASLAAQPDVPSDDPARRHIARSTIARILDTMDVDQRNVLVLAQVHGLTGPEIAQGLGIPLNTAYSRLRLARRHVAQLAAHEDELARDEQPPRAAATKAWALLLPKLSWGAATAAATVPPSVLKIGTAATAIAAATLGLMAVVAANLAPPPADEPALAVAAMPDADADASRSRAAAPAPAPAHAPPPSGAPSVVSSATVIASEASLVSTKPTDATAAPLGSRRRARATPPPPAPVEAPPVAASPTPAPAVAEPPAPAGLAEEAKLLQRAQRALTEGDPDTALALLASHRAEFPSGQLADTREGVWARALCKAGRRAEARAHATVLARRHPGTAVTDAVRDVCR